MGSGYELIRSQISHDETTKEVEDARSGENDLKKRVDHVESLIVTSSDGITSMDGYDKNATGEGSILVTDPLNIAIAKLDNRIDSKAGGGHTHDYAGSKTPGGAANSAERLETARRISLVGDAVGFVDFDGGANVQIDTTLKRITRRDTTTAEKPNGGAGFDVIDVLVTDNEGRVLEVNTKTVTLPTDIMVTNELSHANKAYVTATTGLDTNTGTQVFNRGVYLDTIEGYLNAVQFNGRLNGNASSSSQLFTARNINDTLFDGTTDIVTNKWGRSRDISISDFDDSNMGDPISMDGSSDVIIKLPDIIKAELNGNADTSTRLQTGRAINGVFFDGTSDVDIPINSGDNVTLGGYVKPNTGGAIAPTDTLNSAIGKIEVNLDGKAPLNHNQASSTINAMTGYAISQTGGAILATDTLNVAIGKLEYELNSKTTNKITLGGYTKPNNTSPIVPGDTINQAFGKVEVALDGKAPLNHNQPSNTINALTGYTKPATTSALATTDTLNVALGKLERGLDGKANSSHNQASNTINALTGYVKGNNNGALATTDTLNIALAKLENGLDGKSNNGHTHNYAGSATSGGAANSAVKLQTARTIALAGDVQGSAAFDGTANVTINAKVVNSIAKVSLNRLVNDVTVTATTKTVNIGIANFDIASDVLNVYLAGVRLRPNVDYSFNATSITGLTDVEFVNGDVVSFEVIEVISQ